MPDTEIYLSRPKNDEIEKSDSKGENHLPHSLMEIEAITTAPGVVVFEFHGPLIFLNAESFKRRFTQTILRPIKETQQLKKELQKLQQKQTLSRFYLNESNTVADNKNYSNNSKILNSFQPNPTLLEPVCIHSVIFDCSRVGYLDSKGVEVLVEVAVELKEVNGIQLLLASCSELILKTLLKGNIFSVENGRDNVLSANNCFVSVHDAVTSALNNNNNQIEKNKISQKQYQVLTVNT